MTRKGLLFAVALCVLLPAGVRAQTINAASCSSSDVQTALNSVSQSSATVNIPAGTCIWTSGISYTVPSNTTSLIIQGAGAVSATTGGASTTGTDNTVIYDDLNYSSGPGQAIAITVASGQSFRMTGLAIEENGSSSSPPNAIVEIGGSSTAVRIDHCHFYMLLSAYELRFDSALGVADHDYFVGGSTDAAGGISFNMDGASTLGDETWNQPDQWGTSDFFYVEDSQFNNSAMGDSHLGGRYVLRHNTIISSDSTAPQMYNHGIVTGPERGMRAAEMYLNNITESVQYGANQPTESPNSGTLLYWGNTISGYTFAVELSYDCRTNSTGCNYSYPNPPTGWGHCGTLQGPSNWDGNTNSSGYPCIDQPGRGDGDLLSNGFPTMCNTTTTTKGCSTGYVQWPREALSPIYVWDNTFTPASGYSSVALIAIGGSGSSIIADNRDYYQQFGTYGEPGSFNGTAGIGQGSVTPTTAGAYPNAPNCKAGTDPMTGQAAPGAGWWDTSNNTLYVCTATNTWTAYYTPYTYPHPLQTSTTSSDPAPPTNLAATVH